jgi:EAL domain-containing protein (putative c-di-GMP-specific phosphodiesterase class I)
VGCRLNNERERREALTAEDIKVCYQPQVNAFSGKLAGFEALILWEYPTNGWIYPGDVKETQVNNSAVF